MNDDQELNTAKDAVAELLLSLSSVRETNIYLTKEVAITFDLPKDLLLTASTGKGYRKVSRTKGDTIILGKGMYRGKQAGWIVKFYPKKGEETSVDGSHINHFEIPIKNLHTCLQPADVVDLCYALKEMVPVAKAKVEIQTRDERFGAWA